MRENKHILFDKYFRSRNYLITKWSVSVIKVFKKEIDRFR